MTSTETFPLRIRILRPFNPAIASILRSRLHGLMSRELLVLEYVGRKTGKAYAIPLAYVTREGVPYCVTRTHTSWWRNVAGTSSVAVWLRGERLSATAERMPGASPEGRDALAAFLRANPGTARVVYGVRIDPRGEPDPVDFEREIPNSVVMRIQTAARAS